MSPATRYIRTETAISVAINAVLSALAFVLVFGLRGPVPVWGAGGLVLDGLPQGFMIALMSTLVPGVLTVRRLRRGALAPDALRDGALAARLPANLLLRALVLALLTALGAMAILALAGFLAGAPGVVNWSLALCGKVLLGALLAVLVTPFALRAALATPLR